MVAQVGIEPTLLPYEGCELPLLHRAIQSTSPSSKLQFYLGEGYITP